MSMKGKKLLVSLITVVATLCIVFGQSVTYATKEETFQVGLEEIRKNSTPNTGYAIGDPTAAGGSRIWDLASYDATGTTLTNRNLYCVKGGFGNTWSNPSTVYDKVEYKIGYDLKTEKSLIYSEDDAVASLNKRAAEYGNIANTYYKQILWITDNMFIPGGYSSEAKESEARYALLKAAGIDYEDDYSDYYHINDEYKITDDDIEVVQQLALWYYTNYGDEQFSYAGTTKDMINTALNIKNSVTSDAWATLSDVGKNSTRYGPIKANQMKDLLDYFIDTAEANKDKYNSSNEMEAPITISNSTLGLTDSADGNYYLVGPITLTKNNDLPYTLDVAVKNGSGTDITSSVTYVDEFEDEVNVNSTDEFYVKVAKSSGEKINVDITINYNTTTTTLWVPGVANNEQPIIEVVKTPHQVPVTLSTNPASPFDLALRKFISAVSPDSSIDEIDYINSREPVVSDLDKLRDGTVTTATYSHSKEAIKVKNGDYVEFTIRVYNEGETAGYAEEITDYILNNVGLEFVEGHPKNTEYGWTKNGNKVTTDYLSKSKGTSNLIAAFDSSRTELDFKDVKIVFKVVKPNDFDYNTKLVNIAEVTEDADENGNEVTDRDSTPGTDNKNYPENGYNTENHEDDIDYDHVLLYQFDLSLRKFITAVSSDSTIDASDYLTGTDLREPVVTYEGGKLVYTHPKTAVPVKSGDYVLYTIRVYNEGEIDGYASLIKDSIPEGLDYESVIDNPINSDQMWDYDPATKTITTDILAKGNGEEVGTVAGDEKYTANLLKAFDKTKAISNTSPLNPDYRDVQVVLKVTEPNTSSRQLDNRAEIADDSDENGNPIDDIDSTPNEWIDGEDDQDHDPVKLQTFDLALRKFITSVDGTAVDNRAPEVDATGLEDGTKTTAVYEHSKTPVEVKKGSKVVYTLRVYNEGDVDGYASKVTDYLPEYLEFVTDSTINTTYGWEEVEGSNGRVYTTNYLSSDSEKIEAREGTLLHFKYVQIECKVKNTATEGQKVTNIAEISEYKDQNKVVVNPDRDSKSDSLTDGDNTTGTLPSDTDLPEYNGGTDTDTTDNYIPGQQDDDDFEKIIVRTKVDLALTKFITAISADENIEDGEYLTPNKNIGSETNPYDRQTSVNTNPLKEGQHDAEYTQVKTPLAVENNAYVLYNIRVYNEGDVDVYAGEVTDYLPSNLTFVEGDFNSAYGWTANGQTVKTTYLSATNGTDKKLKAFDKENDNGAGSGLDYKDLPILCRVSSNAEAGKKLINTAEITKYEDENGNELPKDIDSTPENKDPKNVEERTEDDDDYEVIYVKVFDLALRKYISSINGVEQDREPEVDVTPLKNGENTAIYKHSKAPLPVNKGNKIIYTLRVYNEGDVDGYASKITDYIPEGLEFVEDSTINTQYGWYEVEGSNGRKYETRYWETYDGESIIKAFDGTTLDSKYVQIELQVKDTVQVKDKLTNIAEISEYKDSEGTVVNPDKDSTSDDVNVPSDTDLPNYKDDEINNEYVPGQEDDDDFEKVYIPQFDLSLRKFITNIAGKEETSRIPEVSYEDGKLEYKHSKSPLQVVIGDVVVYTIRVYNEGETAGYAAEIADDMPEYLTFLPENAVNTTYGWKMYDKDGNETEDVSKAVQIKTTYLSKEKEETAGANLIHAFDPTKAISDTNPEYKEVKVAFQVNNNAPVQTVITNKAQITDDTDENGNPVEDIDSTPGVWNEDEDDQDLENVIPQQFDLSLIKYVSQVIVTEDGKTTTTETKNTGNNATDIIPKVEIHRKKIDTTTVKFVYTIKITNEGDIAGYAKEITDYVPEGLAFYSEDNTGWTVKEDGVIATRNLENTLLQPGESADVQVTFRWINGANNLNLKRNTAEISEDDNDKHVPDRDSTPNNRKDGEDDIDIADVLLSIKTGRAKTYVLLAGIVLIVLASGIIIIKKYAV